MNYNLRMAQWYIALYRSDIGPIEEGLILGLKRPQAVLTLHR